MKYVLFIPKIFFLWNPYENINERRKTELSINVKN